MAGAPRATEAPGAGTAAVAAGARWRSVMRCSTRAAPPPTTAAQQTTATTFVAVAVAAPPTTAAEPPAPIPAVAPAAAPEPAPPSPSSFARVASGPCAGDSAPNPWCATRRPAR